MVDILNAVLTDGLPAVEAACAEALGHGFHYADIVLNILARLMATAVKRQHEPQRIVGDLHQGQGRHSRLVLHGAAQPAQAAAGGSVRHRIRQLLQ
jgi:hypothetical protein